MADAVKFYTSLTISRIIVVIVMNITAREHKKRKAKQKSFSVETTALRFCIYFLLSSIFSFFLSCCWSSLCALHSEKHRLSSSLFCCCICCLKCLFVWYLFICFCAQTPETPLTWFLSSMSKKQLLHCVTQSARLLKGTREHGCTHTTCIYFLLCLS